MNNPTPGNRHHSATSPRHGAHGEWEANYLLPHWVGAVEHLAQYSEPFGSQPWPDAEQPGDAWARLNRRPSAS